MLKSTSLIIGGLERLYTTYLVRQNMLYISLKVQKNPSLCIMHMVLSTLGVIRQCMWFYIATTHYSHGMYFISFKFLFLFFGNFVSTIFNKNIYALKTYSWLLCLQENSKVVRTSSTSKQQKTKDGVINKKVHRL
jgi:hypothetical protein